MLGHLASLSHLVPNGQLRMRALQLALSQGWNFWDEDILVPWDPPSRDDLRWWCTEGRLEEGISLALRSDQMFWSDASNLGWGATVEDQFASGVWLEGEVSLSINQRELLAVERGLRALCSCLEGRVVAVFSDNTTAVAYLRRQGWTLSPALNAVAQRILRWAERLNIILMPQFVPGKNNVVVDALSRPNQVLGSEWMLHQDVFNWLCQRWPVTVDLFASSLSHCCSVYFAGTDAMLQSWDSLQAYAFPPFTMIGQVLAKVRASQGLERTLGSTLAPASVVSGAAGAADSAPSSSSISMGSSASATRQVIPSKPAHASSSCVETLRRFARASGFSRSVARRLGQARRQSSVANYQSKWLTYRRWCMDKGHSVSQLSVSKVADYFVWLWEDQGLSLSSVKAHRSMLSSVFQFKLPTLGEDSALQDLVRSFSIERPRRPQAPPSWDLDAVLRHLMSSAFEPLESVSLRALTKKTLFLVSLATAKRVSGIQALSKTVAAICNDLVVSFQPHFIAKTERVDAPVPRSFRVLSLREFAGDLEEGSLLCPMRALNIYLRRTSSVVVRASSLFVSPRSSSRPISKNAVSYYLREVISEAGAVRQDVAAPLRAHSVRGIATSVSFLRNWSISKVLEAATWRLNSSVRFFLFS